MTWETEEYFHNSAHHKAQELQSFGFQQRFTISVSREGSISVQPLAPHDERGVTCVLYVALMDDGRVLKVGVSKNGLWSRWKSILKVIGYPHGRYRLRPNETRDGSRLLALVRGHKVAVWSKAALMIELPYAPGYLYPAHHAEEIFLDRHFRPLFGMALSPRERDQDA